MVDRLREGLPAGLEQRAGINGPGDLCERGDQGGPPGLVAGAEAGAVVAVEVLVERNAIAPVRVLLELSVPPNTGRRPVASRRKMLCRRLEISLATSKSVISLPEPVGHSTRKESP